VRFALALLFVGSLLAWSPHGDAQAPPKLTGAQKKKLVERDRFLKDALAFEKAGKITDAIAAAEKMLAIERPIYGNVHPEIVGSLQILARLHERREDFDAAKKERQEIFNAQKKLLGPNDWRTTDARLDLQESVQLAKLNAKNRAELGQADQWLLQANAKSRQGKDREGAELADKAVALRTRLLGTEHRQTAQSIAMAGFAWDRAAQPKKARPLYEQALAIRQKVLGSHPDTSISAYNLGLFLSEQGEDAAARPHLEQSAAMDRRLFGDDHRKTIGTLLSLGFVQQRLGNYKDARLSFDQALTSSKKTLGNNHPTTVDCHSKLGYWFETQGDYPSARSHYQQALTLRTKLVGNNHPQTAVCCSDLGGLLEKQGDFAGARPLLERAVAINKQTLGDHKETANCLNNLGLLLDRQGDHAAARVHYQQALAMYEKVSGPNHLDSANTLNNLAMVLAHEGNFAASRTYHERSLAIKRKAPANNQSDIATSLLNLGVLLIQQRDYAAARVPLEQALAIFKNVHGPNHPLTATTLNSLGVLSLELGDRKAAADYFDRTLAIAKKSYGDDHPNVARALNNLGNLRRATDDHAGARTHLDQALKIQRTSLDVAAVALSERQQLAMNQELREYLDAFLSLGRTSGAGAGDFYRQVLGWKGAVALRQQQLRRLRQDPKLAPLAAELQAVSVRLANLSSAPPDDKQGDSRKVLAELTQKKESLEIKLAQESEAFRKDREAANPDALRQALPADTGLVDFLEYEHSEPDPAGGLVGQRRLTAFVLRKDRPILRVDLGSVRPIADAVESWRRLALRKSSFGTDEADPGQILRRLVWQPIESHLDGVKTVLLGLDGAVGLVPFTALPGKRSRSYLLEEYKLAAVSLPRMLPRLLEESAAPIMANSLLLAGDIDYGASPGEVEGSTSTRSAASSGGLRGNFQALEGTRGEVLALKQTFESRFPKGNVMLLREGQATESAVRREAPNFRWLHVATHGFFAPPEIKSTEQAKANPTRDLFGSDGVVGFHPGLLSGLALTGANRPLEPGQDDGILTALEVAEIDLRKTELVVLSACETGLGKVAGGEGVLGLQRAFQLAGARAVVASLWSVPDEPTRILMERFYANFWEKKMTKLDALMEAQRWMLQEGKDHPGVQRGIKRHSTEPVAVRDGRLPPYYWAAFVLSGDGR
jgi:CHAT domain-containing protein/Tfp pilus assembly protein PilF